MRRFQVFDRVSSVEDYQRYPKEWLEGEDVVEIDDDWTVQDAAQIWFDTLADREYGWIADDDVECSKGCSGDDHGYVETHRMLLSDWQKDPNNQDDEQYVVYELLLKEIK